MWKKKVKEELEARPLMFGSFPMQEKEQDVYLCTCTQDGQDQGRHVRGGRYHGGPQNAGHGRNGGGLADMGEVLHPIATALQNGF